MRAGSSVLSTKEVSTTSDDDADEDEDAVPLLLLPLPPQAATPMVTAITQPDASDRCSRMVQPPSRIGKRSHQCSPQVKGVLFQLRYECVTVSARRSTLTSACAPWLRKRSLTRQAWSIRELK